MSEKLGPVTFGQKQESIFLGRDITRHQDYSEATSRDIDQEVHGIVLAAYERAKTLLETTPRRAAPVAKTLLEKEVVDGAEILRIIEEGNSPGARTRPRRPKRPERAAPSSRGIPRNRSAFRSRRAFSTCPAAARHGNPERDAGLLLRRGRVPVRPRKRSRTRDCEMEAEGAAIIDIGGESTRPGSDPVPAEEELRRVMPVIRGLAAKTKAVISVDTTKAAVANAAIAAGARIVNDTSALADDPEMAGVVSESGCAVVLMHRRGCRRRCRSRRITMPCSTNCWPS